MPTIQSDYRLPPNRRRYIGAYLVFECYRNHEIPIVSVTTTAVTHSAAVASVRMHPNPFLNQLTRGVNVFIVCKISEFGIDTHPKNYVMFSGDVTSVQMSANSDRAEYVINLVDNRRYMTELPTYYIKLIRSSIDMNYSHPTHTRGEGNSVISLQDAIADANFYGIDGHYLEDTFFYDVVTKPALVATFMQEWTGGSLQSYIDKMLDPLRSGKGWEPYYINMNKKKRITNHLQIWDDGIFRSDIAASFVKYAMGAVHSIKDAHAEMKTTYDDALARLSELGYVFNTNVFPGIVGGEATQLDIAENEDPIYKIQSTLFPGELIGICSLKDDPNETEPWKPTPEMFYKSSMGAYKGRGGNVAYYLRPSTIKVYEAKHGGRRYYAIVNSELSTGSNPVTAKPRILEFNVIPKMYGVLPPKCNWGAIDDSVTFNCIINEPPLTALKYSFKDGNSGVSIFSCAYPGELEIYTNEAAEDYSGQFGAGGMTTTTSLISPGSVTQKIMKGKIYYNIMPGQKIYLSNGEVVSDDTQEHADRGSYQGGTDIAMLAGTPIESYTNGKIVSINGVMTAGYRVSTRGIASAPGPLEYWKPGYNGNWGQQVIIETTGSAGTFSWMYNHLHTVDPTIRVGDSVTPGRIIGTCGNTGLENPLDYSNAHLHLSIKVGKWTGSVAAATWVNTSWLFGNLGYVPPRIITKGEEGSAAFNILSYDLPDITNQLFVQEGVAIPETVTVVTDSGSREVYGEVRKLYKHPYHPEAENIYGLKRVSTQGDALYEIVKACQYVNGGSDDIPVMTQNEKFSLLKAKVVQDYHESRVSQNTGSLSINGMDEGIMVGLPYILYHPMQDIFYYGFVQEVSHRIDNSSGAAYTEVSLSSLTTAHSISEIEDAFAGYTKAAYVGKNGLAKLNEFYARITQTIITPEEYDLFDLTQSSKKGSTNIQEYQTAASRIKDKLLAEMGRGLRQTRNICTLERLQNYMYNNQLTVARHDDVAEKESKSRQWMTGNMQTTLENILIDYRAELLIAESQWGRTSADHPLDITSWKTALALEEPEDPDLDQSPDIAVNHKVNEDGQTELTGWEYEPTTTAPPTIMNPPKL